MTTDLVMLSGCLSDCKLRELDFEPWLPPSSSELEAQQIASFLSRHRSTLTRVFFGAAVAQRIRDACGPPGELALAAIDAQFCPISIIANTPSEYPTIFTLMGDTRVPNACQIFELYFSRLHGHLGPLQRLGRLQEYAVHIEKNFWSLKHRIYAGVEKVAENMIDAISVSEDTQVALITIAVVLSQCKDESQASWVEIAKPAWRARLAAFIRASSDSILGIFRYNQSKPSRHLWDFILADENADICAKTGFLENLFEGDIQNYELKWLIPALMHQDWTVWAHTGLGHSRSFGPRALRFVLRLLEDYPSFSALPINAVFDRLFQVMQLAERWSAVARPDNNFVFKRVYSSILSLLSQWHDERFPEFVRLFFRTFQGIGRVMTSDFIVSLHNQCGNVAFDLFAQIRDRCCHYGCGFTPLAFQRRLDAWLWHAAARIGSSGAQDRHVIVELAYKVAPRPAVFISRSIAGGASPGGSRTFRLLVLDQLAK